MSEGASRTSDIGAAARSGFERALERACTWLAIAGGVVMLAFTAASVASIVSRTLFGSPLVGDFELTERGTAIAVFAMIPYCHLRGGHVVVDMFVGMLPPGPRRVLAIAAEVLFALVAALMTWRLALGGLAMHQYNETSMMLQIPTWWLYVPIVASMTLLTLVCVARAARGGREFA
mgnify:CR=1 FL=1